MSLQNSLPNVRNGLLLIGIHVILYQSRAQLCYVADFAVILS